MSKAASTITRALIACFGLPALFSCIAARPETVSLSGTWRFQLDRANAGVQEKWFERALPGKIKLPGSLPAQGIGDDVTVDTKWTGDIVDKSWFTAPEYEPYRRPGNVKVPFWLQPDKYYAGAAWYQRDFEIPSKWRGKRVVLTLGRSHWETRVWVDGHEVGSNNSLSTPHEYDLGSELPPGKHQLTIRVDNSLVVDIGVNSHSISDHTQGNWNGIVGDISLHATTPIWVEDLQVYPHVTSRTVTVKGRLGNATAQAGSGKIEFSLDRVDLSTDSHRVLKTINVAWQPQGGEFEEQLTMPQSSVAWSEFTPVLYSLTARVSEQDPARSVIFGLREIATEGTQFVLNGQKIFIRGTLECCIFPRTGHPPPDVASWERIVRVAKGYGLNLIRFHSWCPPEAAFVAADKLGFYYQVEIASWANMSTTLGDGKPVDQWLYQEAERILKSYGNHPSFLLVPYGNEPGGRNANAYLAKWVEHWKTADPRRLYTSGSGWPQIPENQFHVTPDPRIQAWGGGLNSRINKLPPETRTDYRQYIEQRTVPVISHEIGQWCVYPNFDEIPKYTGYLKPKNFDIFRDSLRAHRMGNLAHKFLLASGKLQTLCYKEDIESALRTPGMGGFELLDLHDFPGQGTALVGVLDPFWDDKGYVTAKEYSRFCNQTVPLARLSKRVFTTDETLEADFEVTHFGAAPLLNAGTTWRLVGDNHHTFANGHLRPCDIPLGNATRLGNVSIDLKNIPAPARYKLVLSLDAEAHSPTTLAFENDWDIWVFPPAVNTQPPPGVLVANALDEHAVSVLNSGGRVLLLVPPARVKGDAHGKVALGFSSIFWNTAWTGRQPPHTLGILCEPKHPALAQFPTDYHSNWQWWYLVSRAGAMILDDLPAGLPPTVQVVDDWVTNRKLVLVFEAKVASGKLLVCSIDLQHDLEANPVARQMLHSLLAYMAGPRFKPSVLVTAGQVRQLFAEPAV